MAWDTIASLITIVGSLIALGTVLAKLIATLTRLDETLKGMQRDLAAEREGNVKEHEKMNGRLDNHEVRISTLEHEVK